MSIQQAYTTWAATYDQDRNRTRDLDQEVTRRTLAGMRVRTILEIGCGTGKNTVLFAQLGDHLRALDFSEGMLAKAREKIVSPHVTFTLADLTRPWPCDDEWAELVVCNLVLEHIKDLSFILSEAARILVAGGRFFICELHPFRQYQGTQAGFKRGGETTNIQAFVHHLSDFMRAAKINRFALESLREWWHEDDQGLPPRLVSFLFKKSEWEKSRYSPSGHSGQVT